MPKIFIVRSTDGELQSSELGGLKVVYAFEEKSLAESYCARLNAEGRAHKTEAIPEADFREYVIPVLKSAKVEALVFNLPPGESTGENAFSVDISHPANPRTFDFHLRRWLTAKESRRLRKLR